jgi:hypothetical protein
MILRYLRSNPRAGDTLEGITKWWLELERIEGAVDEVAEVCELLVKEGELQKRKGLGGRVFYKTND